MDESTTRRREKVIKGGRSTFTISLSREDRSVIEALARAEGVSASAIVRRAVKMYRAYRASQE